MTTSSDHATPLPARTRRILVGKPWGGTTLADLDGIHAGPDDLPVGEAWEVADLGHDATPVRPATTTTADGGAIRDLTGDPSSPFPLLVKHLDIARPLSVQVHPTVDAVRTHPGWVHKTETWAVVAAEPDATLWLGVRDGVAFDDVRAAAGTAAIVELLRTVPVAAGDVFHLPAGLIHAMGGGIVIAEVQTPSDTTFRFHDWAELGDREPRELHVIEALASVRNRWDLNTTPPRAVTGDGLLVDTPYYRLHRHRADAGDITVAARETATVLVLVDGEVSLPGAGRLLPRDTAIIPPGWSGTLTAHQRSSWLEAELP